MRALKFALAVAATSIVLVAVLGVVGVVAARSAVASAVPFVGAMQFGPHAFGGSGVQLPPELQGLTDLPAADRFSHFAGVQVNLKDKNNQPLTINVVPGSVSAVGSNSLTLAANDGTTKSFTLNDKTMIRGKAAQGSSQTSQASLTKDDKVIVVTLNNDNTALAVIDGGTNGFAAGGFGPPWGWHR